MKGSISKNQFVMTAIGPQLFFLILIFLGPFIYMIWISFTDLSFMLPNHDGNFVGVENYVNAFQSDPIFWSSVKKSIIYVLLCVLPQIIFAILIVEWLSSREFLRRFFTPFLSLPILLPAVVIGLYWRLLLQGEFGIISYYLSKLGLFTEKAILSDVKSILLTLSVIDFWQWAPFVVLVFLAARLSLPVAPQEAAKIDGAKPFQIFRDVTLPLMLPTIGVVFIIRAIDSFKEFDKVFILTGGGPGNASEMSSIYIWRVAFKQWNLGYGAVLCTVVYLLIFFGSQLFFRLYKKEGIG